MGVCGSSGFRGGVRGTGERAAEMHAGCSGAYPSHFESGPEYLAFDIHHHRSFRDANGVLVGILFGTGRGLGWGWG